MSRLAINGAAPVRTEPFPAYVTMGEEERRAVAAVMESGVLSQFLGSWSPDFYGGPQVQEMEREWCDYFRTPHAISVNSATSGLFAAVGAAGVGPGDEVIVSPYTMSASATCVLGYNAVPVFADIDPRTFCITADTIRAVLTPRTRAVVVVDIFGQPADCGPIMRLAGERGLTVIEDAAQAPGAMDGDRFAGTLAHLGVFSLNYHKVIHTGEGGVVVTADDRLAERLQLIRNHAEAVVAGKGVTDLVNLLGFNYRLTELQAAIGREQLKKLPRLVAARQENAAALIRGLGGLPGITPPLVRDGVRHGFYVFPITYDERVLGRSRRAVARALRAEGIPVHEGYVLPIYRQPLYQKRIAYGDRGCPFACPWYQGTPRYEEGACPVAERMYASELIYGDYCHAGIGPREVGQIVEAFAKVTAHAGEIPE